MAISEKIVSRINELNEDEKLKELMFTILEMENYGHYRYIDRYDTLIQEYISKEKVGEDSNGQDK